MKNNVVIEITSVEKLSEVHHKQVADVNKIAPINNCIGTEASAVISEIFGKPEIIFAREKWTEQKEKTFKSDQR